MTQGDDVTFTTTGVADSDGDVVSVAFLIDLDQVATDTDGSDGYTATVSTADLAPGIYTVNARVTDDDGATATTNAAFTVVAAPVVDEPPTVASLAASPNPVFAGEPLTLTALGVEDDNGIDQVEFFLSDPGSGIPLSRGIDTDGSDGWSITFPADAAEAGAGFINYEALALDTIGQQSNVVSISVDIFTDSNVAPVVDDVQALPDPVVQGEALTIVAFSVFDADGNLASVQLLRDGVVLDSTSAVPAHPTASSSSPSTRRLWHPACTSMPLSRSTVKVWRAIRDSSTAR